jgi:hypothetical protein
MGLGLASLVATAFLGMTPSAPATETCDVRGTRALVVNFVSAFNRGDTKRLDSLFARGPWWKWFSVGTAPGKRIQGAAYNRQTLLKYFTARHRRHERLQLRTFRSAERESLGYVNFSYELIRKADDMRMPVQYVGKGAMSCWTGNIAVWSMGAES